MPPEPVQPIRNVMTVDVEEYFHVTALSERVAPGDWERLQSGVERNVDRLLQLYADTGVSATFFILGWVAERHPAMVRRIAAQGHEVGSHGYAHQPAYRQSEAEFTEDARRSKQVLEDALGAPVIGYRAASFSIVARNQWAFGVLDRLGFLYSSSVNPIRHDIYGFPDAPRHPFTPEGTKLIECPVTTLEFAGQRWPCGGGGYFRILPYGLFRWALRRVNAGGQPGYFYLHPWEIDTDQQRVAGLSWRSRFRHYTNLHRTEGRLKRLLADFQWGRFDEHLGLRPAA